MEVGWRAASRRAAMGLLGEGGDSSEVAGRVGSVMLSGSAISNSRRFVYKRLWGYP